MNEIKQAALGICVLAAAAGLLRMLIPCEKYKLHNICDSVYFFGVPDKFGHRCYTRT